MKLRIANIIRPNNEAVASISYKPVYDISRKVAKLVCRWDIAGRIINYPIASQSLTTAEILKLQSVVTLPRVDLVFLEDVTNKETALSMKISECIDGPYLVDYALPNAEDDVYATGIGYRLVYEGVMRSNGSAILAFEETVDEDPGGPEFVYVGGAVNLPERQLGTQNKTYKYTQRGSATGLFAYPAIPPAIWPFALVRYEPRVTLSNPKVLGTNFDQEFTISWEYNYEWHVKLNGIPHRRTY
jgi:hypothetical protein